MGTTKDDLETAFKKAVKSLEGEKRAAVKKAKGTKGKKAKEALAAVEAEYDQKLQDLKEKHEQDLKDLEGGSGEAPEATPAAVPEASETTAVDAVDTADVDSVEAEKERKREKARRKKQAKKEKELQREREEEEETANAGPSLRQLELDQIESVLTPLKMKISEVEADGHCLYRAVGAQTGKDYSQIRAICADTLAANADEFSPFCEYNEKITSFSDYVEQVRNSAEWGGHLELRALGMALDRPIFVYSVQSGTKPLGIHDERNDEEKDPILLSYHLNYYALGEHYNQVVKLE